MEAEQAASCGGHLGIGADGALTGGFSSWRQSRLRAAGRAWGSGLTAPSPTELSRSPACTLSCSSSSARQAAAVRAALALHPKHQVGVRPWSSRRHPCLLVLGVRAST
jgi:hypothetical protein